jgi:hypothetical protein
VAVREVVIVRADKATAFGNGVTGPSRLIVTPSGAMILQEADSETLELNAFSE